MEEGCFFVVEDSLMYREIAVCRAGDGGGVDVEVCRQCLDKCRLACSEVAMEQDMA